MNKMNQSQTRSPRKRLLSLILAVILMIGLLPISAFASNVGTQANDSSKTAESQEFMRIFHLDCGRKYFTVSEIEGIIDQLAENHFTHLQLAFGNDGLRFLLDDMSVTVNGTTYDKEKVKSAVQSGNSTYSSSNGTAGTMLSEGDMNAIIKHANEKGIQVIPMFNSPYHMDALLNAMENLGITDARKKLNNVNRYLNLESANAVAFVKALQQKYMDYFKSKGCKYYNIATDEYAFDHITDAVYTEFAKYVNDLAKMVKDTGMTPLAYNDGFYWKTRTSSVDFDTDIVICYWSNGGNRASAETLAGKHFKILNNTDDWYYVLGDYLYKAWGRDGQWGYADAMNGLSTTKVTQVKGDTNGKVVPIGSVLCCWCDGPSMGYDENGYSSPSHPGAGQTNKESVYNLIKAMAENNPDYFTGKVKLSASDDATGVSVAVTGAKGQKATVEVKKITSGFTFDTEAHVSYNVTPAVDGKAYTGEGTVTLPVPEGWATEASRIRAYIIDNGAVKLISGTLSDGKYTFQVPHFSEMGLVQLAEGAPSKTENITLTVGGTKTVSVDGIQEIVTAPNGQYATATTTTIPAGAVSYKATASANIDAYESYSWSNLIDGNASTFYWSHGAQTAGAYAQVDLETAIPFDTVRVTSPSDVGNDYCENATVQVSVDRSEWTDIGSYTGNKAAAQSFANTLGSARYIRVLIKNARNNWWKLAEIEWGNTQNGQFTRMAASGTVTVPERTSISFTGVAVGNTTAVIGDTQYNITVNDRVEIPITIIDYRADGLLFDYSYAHWGDYPDSYRYSLVHGKAIEETHYSTFVTASKDSNGLYYIDGTNSNVEKIAGTRIEQTRTPENSNYVGKFNPNNMDNSWSRAGLVQEKLGANGMPVYTDAAVRYVASLLEAGYYNNVSDSAYNCNSYIYETFVAANGKRTIHNTSTTAFSPQFDVAQSKIISYTNTLKVTAVSGGKTLSDSAIHTIYSYNAGGTDKTFVVDFGLPLQISGIFDSGANEYIDANTGAIKLKEQPTYGNVTDFESKGMDTSMVYKLKTNTTINGRDTIKLSVPYNFGSTSANLDKNIYIIPASNVYYEDSLASFADGAGSAADAVWSPDGKATSEQQSATQALEELGKSGVYGYDGAYNKDNSSMLSMGTARKVTVTSAMADPEKWTNDSAWPTASFTFTGTGFDVISLTNNKSGAIFVDVYKGSKAEGDRVRSYVVNNYYGYTYDETSKTWITTSGDNALYQIPVMKITDLDHGTYTAVVTVFYDGLFNQTGKSEYSFWLDAIRVYNPMGEDYDYTADNEGYPQYIKLRDEVVKKTATPNGNALFIDGKENAMIAEYANYGPNNEVYLMNGQAITFKIPQNANVDSIQIGAKAPDGKLAQMVVNKDKPVEISTATEMYYKINVNVSAADQTVVIANTDGSGILSLTNLKITFKNKPTDKITLTALNNQEQENAVSLVRALFTAPVATFSPETFEADWSRAVRAGKRATLTVKTSADVESITVDGQSITSYTTRTQRTGWGWWSPKVTYRVFTYTTTAPAQTTDYAVCAVNAEGTASEPITATLTVRPATWWNWWF